MADTPQFVKLHDRVAGDGYWSGILADLDTGWTVSGFDVVAMPDPERDPQAHKFAQAHLRLGNLEPASEQEHQVVREADDIMAQLHPVGQHVEEGSHWPENVLASHSRLHHQRILEARGGNIVPAPTAEAPPGSGSGAKAASGAKEVNGG